MITQIDIRKNIIVSLKSSYFGGKKNIEKKIQYLEFMSSLNIIVTTLIGGILLASMISSLLGNEFFNWQKMELLTILSLSFILTLPNELYELKLLKHLQKINRCTEFSGIEKLNTELKSIVNKLNNRIKNNWLTILLTLFIMAMGTWQLSSNNPYWSYMKIPTIILFGIIAVRFKKMNKILTENINETEKYCS